MTSPGRLQDRFFWEYVNHQYAIYDRTRGAGCFGENFVAHAVDGVVAEMMCGLMNPKPIAETEMTAEEFAALRQAVSEGASTYAWGGGRRMTVVSGRLLAFIDARSVP